MFENKEIVLKDGYNRGLIVCLILSIVLIAGFLSSKYLLPDDRVILHKNQDTRLYMGQIQVYTPVYYDYDADKGMIQARFTEKHQVKNLETENKISYGVYDEIGKQIPYVVTSTSCKLDEENMNLCNVDVIIQAVVSNDFYGVIYQIMQEDTSIETVQVDYREVRHKTFREKGENYYPEIEVLENLIADYEEQIDQLYIDWHSLVKSKNTSAAKNKRQQILDLYAEIGELKIAKGRALLD